MARQTVWLVFFAILSFLVYPLVFPLAQENPIIEFVVEGSLFHVGYFTKVKLGIPPKEFKVIIDTGGNDFWVKCLKDNKKEVEHNLFDPKNSSSCHPLPCSDKLCPQCTQSNQCSYSTTYVGGSKTSGEYFKDTLHFNTNFTAEVVFGCNKEAPRSFEYNGMAGILGLGQGNLSLISQLSSKYKTSKVFAHCLNLRGTGGSFVIRDVSRRKMVYTPLVQSNKSHYYVNLHGIGVGGQVLPIDPSVFALSANGDGGTYFDSGATLSFLVKEAYIAFVNAINAAVLKLDGVTSQIMDEKQCYLMSRRAIISDIFPPMSYHFEGKAPMNIKPEEYLFPLRTTDSESSLQCIGFLPSSSTTILSDLVLREKVVVFDLVKQVIGWRAHNCSLPINKSSSRGPGVLVIMALQVAVWFFFLG